MTVDLGRIMTAPVVTAGTEISVGYAAELMDRHGVGCLVITEGEKLVGIVTSRDIRRSHPNRLVADAMTSPVITAFPETSIWEARDTIERHQIERLVIVQGGRPVGIVTKAQLYNEMGKHFDVLTGLPGAVFLQREASRLLCDGKEVAVIFVDLDDFGAIDKALGHVCGDEILRCAAQVLREAVEDGVDLLCRYAGDEFAVVTVRPFEDARKLAWRLVEALARAEWPYGVRVTGSAGLAGGRRESPCTRESGTDTVSTLINMASLASTQAKKTKSSVVAAGQVAIQEAL